jgi:ceramide glucosyltransferase
MAFSTETDLVAFISCACTACAGIGCVYLLIASAAVLRFSRRRELSPASPMPVTILKPLHGAEPGLTHHLASFRDQEYGAPVQMLCGVEDRSDPAVQAVKQLVTATQAVIIDLKIDARQHGSNRKVSNLANISTLSHHDVLVMADSDIEVGPLYLAEIVAELQKPGVGAVTCLYHGVAAPGLWSRHAALAINSHFLPNVVAGLSFGLVKPCFGSTIAMTRAVLARIGGLEAFVDCLADDYAIGTAVRAAGYRISIPAFSVGHACFQRDLWALLAHELRAARTIKSINPLGYCGTVVSHPLPLALIGASLGQPGSMLLAAMALICRAVLCLAVEHAFWLERQPYRLLPMRDLLSFVVFVASFFGSSVSWRGFRYRVAPDGSLVPSQNEANP